MDVEIAKIIAEIIYKDLDYMYCYNCRFNQEILREEAIEKYGSWGCEDCHRKYNGWGVSMAAAKDVALKIMKELEGKI